MRTMAWVNVALGVWLTVSAFVFRQPSGTALTGDAVTGLFVVLVALWSARAYRPRMGLAASWTTVLLGAWIVSAPFVLGYERSNLGVANALAVGLAVIAAGVVDLTRWAKQAAVNQ